MSALEGPAKAILFDKDGTLFDFARTWEAWARAFLLRLSETEEQAVRAGAAIGFEFGAHRFLPDSLAIAGTPSEVAQALSPHFPGLGPMELIDILNEEASAAPQAEAVPLRPLLDGLQTRGYALGVATNDAEAPARVHLARAGVETCFDFIAGFDSGFGAKPGPGQLMAFAQAVGVETAACVMVGDSTHDLLAAQAAGMKAVGVLTGMATREDLAPHADVVLPDIGALPKWLATG